MDFYFFLKEHEIKYRSLFDTPLNVGSKSIRSQGLPDVPSISVTTEMVKCLKNDEKPHFRSQMTDTKSWQDV